MRYCVLAVAGFIGAQIALAPATADNRNGQISVPRPVLRGQPLVNIFDGRMSAKLEETPLGQVLESIAQQSGARILLHESTNEAITVEFSNLALEEGLRRILHGRSTAYFYSESFNAAGRVPTTKLLEIRILASSSNDASNVKIFSTAESGVENKNFTATAPLGDQTEKVGVAGLTQQLLRSPDVEARQVAAHKLGRTWSEDAVAPLVDVLTQDSSAAVRQAAATALGETWSESAIQPLINALQSDTDALVREQAAQALARTAGEEAVDALTQALERDGRWYVRDAAASALATIGGHDALDALARAASDDRDAWVRETAADAAANSPR